jgi:hypothetical protein
MVAEQIDKRVEVKSKKRHRFGMTGACPGFVASFYKHTLWKQKLHDITYPVCSIGSKPALIVTG